GRPNSGGSRLLSGRPSQAAKSPGQQLIDSRLAPAQAAGDPGSRAGPPAQAGAQPGQPPVAPAQAPPEPGDVQLRPGRPRGPGLGLEGLPFLPPFGQLPEGP